MAAELDEPVVVQDYDPHWEQWFAADAEQVRQRLRDRLLGLEHFGSTAVPGMAAKPIIDILVAPAAWPFAAADLDALKELGYEHLGQAGVVGREYLRRRGQHATNLAVVQWQGPLWHDNLALRDYLRAYPEVAAEYAATKKRAWQQGATRLLAYSDAKQAYVGGLLQEARRALASGP